jgi:uncharacterized protein (DUF488 family)
LRKQLSFFTVFYDAGVSLAAQWVAASNIHLGDVLWCILRSVQCSHKVIDVIFTIGYEGLDIHRFISLLSQHDIEVVVDIRELPLSRKPGFSKKALASLLHLSGFQYQHMADLGCPKPVRDRYKEDGNWNRYTEGFLNYLQTQGAAIARLSDLTAASNCVLLCYEADFNFCHRSLVANAVRDACGVAVTHINTVKAKTTSAASRQLSFA